MKRKYVKNAVFQIYSYRIDTKLRYGNLMSTCLPAKNLVRMFYVFILICVGTMPICF